MTKKDLAQRIADDLGVTVVKAQAAIAKTLAGIIDTLAEEGRVEFRNFGVFVVKKRKARTARNPRTGEKVEVPARSVVTFKPGKEMEAKVNTMTNVPADLASST